MGTSSIHALLQPQVRRFLLSQRRQRQHWARSGPHYFLGHAAEDQVRKPRAPVRLEHVRSALTSVATCTTALASARDEAAAVRISCFTPVRCRLEISTSVARAFSSSRVCSFSLTSGGLA